MWFLSCILILFHYNQSYVSLFSSWVNVYFLHVYEIDLVKVDRQNFTWTFKLTNLHQILFEMGWLVNIRLPKKCIEHTSRKNKGGGGKLYYFCLKMKIYTLFILVLSFKLLFQFSTIFNVNQYDISINFCNAKGRW